MFNTDIAARLACAALAFYPPFAAWTMPDSLSNQMRILQGTSGELLLGCMGFLSLVIAVDVVVNSVLKHCKLHWTWLTKQRDKLYLAVAFCAISVPFSVSKFASVDSGASYLYLIIFFEAAGLAWCDAYAKRNTIPRKVRRAKTL